MMKLAEECREKGDFDFPDVKTNDRLVCTKQF